MIDALLAHPDILSAEPFQPHAWEEIARVGAFPKEVNAPWYASEVKKFEALRETALDAWRITYRGQAGKVTGLALLPKGTTPESKLPLIVFNRGGTREFGRLTAHNIVFPLSPLVAAGYGILASNYRGNDGGEGTEEHGGADVQDVLDLLRISKKMPWWDGEHAYLLGWSRGGMMTYLALKAGAQVQAAASLAGLADLVDSSEKRPKLRAMYEEIFPDAAKGEGALQAAMEARSAVCWPDQMHAPLLLLHGDADNRVPFEHSEKLAAGLERAGLEHKLVRYEAGTHSLSRYHKEVTAEILAWFAAHR